MSEGTVGLLIGFLFGLLAAAFVWVGVAGHYRAAAVERGFAEWTINAHGETTWAWKEAL